MIPSGRSDKFKDQTIQRGWLERHTKDPQ